MTHLFSHICICLLLGGGSAWAQTHVSFEYVTTIGGRGNGPRQFLEPNALTLDMAGNLYVADTGNDRIQKLKADGTFLREAGGFGWDDGQFNKPTGIAVGKGLELYVADSRNHRIQIYNLQLLLMGVIGGQGTDGSPEFGELSRVNVSDAGEVFVTDLDADQLVQIDRFSRIDRGYSGFAYDRGQVRRPMGIAVDGRDAVYVCDRENDRVVVFNRSGGLKRTLGDDVLVAPRGLCLTPDRLLVVADTGHHRIVVFDMKTGDVVGHIGGPDPGKGPLSFHNPNDVVFGKAGALFVLDSGNHRIVHLKMQVSRHEKQ
ncbi:MAG: tripartite motif-containing protein 71 [Candidatus Latescibacterota bacterium]|jgi:tripartite motif-containing protein 71